MEQALCWSNQSETCEAWKSLTAAQLQFKKVNMLLVYRRRPFNWRQTDSLTWWWIGTKCDIWFSIRGQFTCHWPVNPGGHRHWAKRCWSTQVAPSAQLCPWHQFTTEMYTGSVSDCKDWPTHSPLKHTQWFSFSHQREWPDLNYVTHTQCCFASHQHSWPVPKSLKHAQWFSFCH